MLGNQKGIWLYQIRVMPQTIRTTTALDNVLSGAQTSRQGISLVEVGLAWWEPIGLTELRSLWRLPRKQGVVKYGAGDPTIFLKA